MNEDKSKLEEGIESLEDDKLDDFLTTKAQSAVREKEMELDLKIRRAKSGGSDEATDKIRRLEKTKSQVQRMAELDKERRAIRERSIEQVLEGDSAS